MVEETLTLVKLGGSLITDKSRPFTERKEVIDRLAREIHSARERSGIRIILGHGGGSYPHRPAKKYRTADGMVNEDSARGIAEVQDAAARLNRTVVRSLIDAGEDAVSMQPSASCISERGKVKEWYTAPIEMLLEKGMLPVVYGDVSLDTRKGCCILSTEELFDYLTMKMQAARVIMVGKVEGVMTADPGKDRNAEIVKKITPQNFRYVRKHLQGSDATDVTGGMVHKVEKALKLAEAGAEVHIISGMAPGRLEKALLGQKVTGTVIRA